MPKCINDVTKSYRGDEPSPKGYGYSAGNLEPGYKLKGTDGNIWCVNKTIKGNRWFKNIFKKVVLNDNIKSFNVTGIKKQKDKVMMYVESEGTSSWQDFDFAKLSDDCYRYAYLPICEKMTELETGLEEKFGGSYPYLTENNAHGIYDDGFIFLCQFRDPRSEDEDIYQVFVSEDCMDHKIMKIKLNNEAIEKQYKFDINSELEPFKITGWNKIKELISFDKLREKFKFSKDIESILCDKYLDHELTPSHNIKVGGTPMSCQGGNYDDMNLLQLSPDYFLNFEWGDAGIAHVSTNLDLEWDCC